MTAILRNVLVLATTICAFGVAWRYRRRLARAGTNREDWDRLFRSAFETAPQAAAFSDHFACFQYVNAAFVRLWGFAYPSQVCGRWLFEFLAQPENSAEILRMLREHGSWSGQTEARRRDSSVFRVQLSARVISTGNGKAGWVLWCFTDRADQPPASAGDFRERELLALAGAALAHDVNNLLTVVIGNSSLALSRPGESAESRRLWSEILDTGQQAAEITRQYLSLRGQPAAPLPPVSMNSVIANGEGLLARLAGSRVAITVSLAPDVGLVRVPPAELLQVLMNLVLNAREAMPNGGAVTIQTTRQSRGPVGEGPFVVLTVTDTGTGMDGPTRARAFEAFFTSKSSARDAGLGLTIVSSIVHKAGGQIRLDTQPGAGTSLHLYFPEAV